MPSWQIDPDAMGGPFETVHTVEDYYDGPRAGIANHAGQPHYYRSIYLDLPDWNPDEDRFELSPVSPEVVAAALEAAEIFNRWNNSKPRTTGLVIPDDEFGALPADRARRQELAQFLERSYAVATKAGSVLVRGHFQLYPASPSGLQVRWNPVG